MQIQQTLSRLDDLLHQCRLDEAETLLTQAVAQAQAEADTDSEKLLRNEQIGFYRDCGKFPAALETAAAARALFEQTGETDTISYATTLLNCANAYRAAGNYEDAFAAYETVQSLYARLLPPDDGRVASLWNNLALLYQETEQWEQACTCLKQALELVQHDPDPTRTGISAANLAVSLLRLHRTAEALCYLQQAEKILIGKTPSDFHASAVYAGFGDAYYQLGEYARAADAYEKALPEIELHMGRNNFYEIVSENLKQTYARLGGGRPEERGLRLCERYYIAFGKPMLERNFGAVLPRLAIGLAGEGSECLGYDDALSRDHDFGAGFCIWVPDDLPEETVQQLRNAYAVLACPVLPCRRQTAEWVCAGRVPFSGGCWEQTACRKQKPSGWKSSPACWRRRAAGQFFGTTPAASRRCGESCRWAIRRKCGCGGWHRHWDAWHSADSTTIPACGSGATTPRHSCI